MPLPVYIEVCPKCGRDLHRSRRRGIFERVLTTVFRLAMFRCHGCRARFYVFPTLFFPVSETRTLREDEHAGAARADQVP